jgi:hypothetical protein
MCIEKILLSETPKCLGLVGPVINNEGTSPFGPLTDHAAMVRAGFDAVSDDTTFILLGTGCAGSHASALRKAEGSLRIGSLRQSFWLA